jgi:hypothetical protein
MTNRRPAKSPKQGVPVVLIVDHAHIGRVFEARSCVGMAYIYAVREKARDRNQRRNLTLYQRVVDRVRSPA